METGGGAGRWCLTRWASGEAFGSDTGSDDGGSSGNFPVWWVVNGWVHSGCWVVAVDTDGKISNLRPKKWC